MAADLNQVEEKRALDESHADQANWRGYSYFNKADKRIFPPKRGGSGYTVNFANKWSVIVFAIIIAIFISIAVLVSAIAHR